MALIDMTLEIKIVTLRNGMVLAIAAYAVLSVAGLNYVIITGVLFPPLITLINVVWRPFL